jgi:UDP-N-acetylglucosamine acyltransferase
MEDAGFSPETIGAIERAYEILLDSGLNTTQAAQAIGTELAGSPEAAEIVAFLAGSKRGLARGGKR